MRQNTDSVALNQRNGSIWGFLWQEMKPKGKIFTPFNIISLPIILVGLYIIYIRFTQGLGAVNNLTQEVPWGLWKGFNVVTGVAFAGGAYVLAFLVYILNLKRFKPILRVTILNGFLAYVFYSIALIIDLGRPLDIINIVIGNNFGVSSVMFLVGWHFLLYMAAMLLEFSPAIAEWLNLRKLHKVLSGLTLAAVVFGITLSVLHQSGLGALF
ncbi:MAG TPA: NrfD/PsrC family molybdoenzyme membrane anchor subunit, partial [Bacteroidales bacterium]|nr:NrfD/PsrC family molybdoenzyme membrane anchor subunit [Bacteroidales bacterium]